MTLEVNAETTQLRYRKSQETNNSEC